MLPVMYPTPVIFFDYLTAEKWADLPLQELHDYLDGLRKKVKEAIGYHWDNTHFYITNLFNRPAVTFQIYNDGSGMSFWCVGSGVAIDFGTPPEKITKEFIREIIEHGELETMCNKCRKWIPNAKVKRYSYAGGVCKKCYDPKIHLPPDSSG